MADINYSSNRNESEQKSKYERQGTAIALGKFDGTHIGHQKLIRELAEVAEKNDLIPLVLLIRTSSEHVEDKEIQRKRLISYGAKEVAELKLTSEIAKMSAEKFLKEVLLNQLSMKYLVGGTDISFGNERKGNADFLKCKAQEYGFQYKLIDKISLEESESEKMIPVTVSSTLLHEKLKTGEMESVKSIMGKYYDISGDVVHGRHLGTEILGIPTINQVVEPDRILPPYGVYLSRVTIQNAPENVLYGVSNLGIKPTIGEGKEPLSLETHLFNIPPEKDLYGKTVQTELLHYLRPEQKFDSLEDLKKQLLEKDIPEALKYFEKVKNNT